MKNPDLAVTGTAIVVAALVTLSATGAPAASRAPAAAASHVTGASVTAAPAQGVIHVMKRGLVKDCVEIELGNSGYQIWDEGFHQPVTLQPAPASCWNLVNKFSTVFGFTTYTGYEYQDLRGDCLWDDDGLIETNHACQAGSPYESFFGIKCYRSGPGWTFTDVSWGPNGYMAAADAVRGYGVSMIPASGYYDHFWNFP